MLDNRIKRGAILFLTILSAIAIFPCIVHAFAVSTPYMEDNTLKLRPGEEYTYVFTVQNGEDRDYYAIIEYNSTGNIAEMRETSRMIPKQTYDTRFEVFIKVPIDAQQGEKYSITYSARPRINESGTVLMGVEIRRGITVEVSGEKSDIPVPTDTHSIDKPKNNSGTVLAAVIILIAIAMMLLMVWNVSKKIASKISQNTQNKKTDYTISQAMSLEDVKTLLKKISDEEYEFPEIKNIFKEKLTEFSSRRVAKDIDRMTRTELIKEIDKVNEGK
jgi:hypothetical protein